MFIYPGPLHGNGEAFFFRKGILVDFLLHPTGRDPGVAFKTKWYAAFGSIE